MREAEAKALPVPIPTTPRLATESILAEVKRNARWLINTAAPSIALAFQYLGTDSFMELVTHQKLPGRLQKFTHREVASAYERAFKRITGSGFGRLGLDPYRRMSHLDDQHEFGGVGLRNFRPLPAVLAVGFRPRRDHRVCAAALAALGLWRLK
jgi:hypothetical protein